MEPCVTQFQICDAADLLRVDYLRLSEKKFSSGNLCSVEATPHSRVVSSYGILLSGKTSLIQHDGEFHTF